LRSLLDVNVLLALLDANHIHHREALAWWDAHQGEGWASCPLTQNGVLRIMSSQSYLNRRPAAEVAERLALVTAHAGHQFWADGPSLLEPGIVKWAHVIGARQITDVYLLALAVRKGGRFVTLDKGISLHAIPDAKSHQLVTLFP